MHVVPGCQLGSVLWLALEMLAISCGRVQGQTERMLVEDCDGDHFLVGAVIGVVVLD